MIGSLRYPALVTTELSITVQLQQVFQEYLTLGKTMITSRLVHTAFGVSLWLGIHMISATGHFAQAQINPPPGSGTPGSTTGGGSRP